MNFFVQTNTRDLATLLIVALFATTVTTRTTQAAEATESNWSVPRTLCDKSWDLTVNSLIARGRAMGQVPTEADKQKMRDMNPCACIYRKMNGIAEGIDLTTVTEDLTAIEQWSIDLNIPTGYSPKNWERREFSRTLNYGETFLTSRGLAQMECMNESG